MSKQTGSNDKKVKNQNFKVVLMFKDVVVDVETPDRHLLKGRKVCAMKYRTPVNKTNLKCRVEVGLTSDDCHRRRPRLPRQRSYQDSEDSEDSDNESDNTIVGDN